MLVLCLDRFFLFQGMDSGFGEDDQYTVYDQPFRGDRTMAQNIYRPSKNVDKDLYGDDVDTLMQNNRLASPFPIPMLFVEDLWDPGIFPMP